MNENSILETLDSFDEAQNNVEEQSKLLLQNNNSFEATNNLFNIQTFIKELAVKSEEKNRNIQLHSNNITSYDIAHNCIRQILFKIRNVPSTDYTDQWLPIALRTTLGNATHEFIQQSKQFTELEVSLKVPSINVSCRLDALINNKTVVEIKSCTYTDYRTIINKRKPRDGDFYQALLYKYLLENHLEEIKKQKHTRTKPPKLDKYEIDNIQLIYLAHDVISSEYPSMNKCLEANRNIRKLLESKKNPFCFITTIDLDLTNIDVTPYLNYIKDKISEINKYLDNNSTPGMDNKYTDLKSCIFCLYKTVCGQYQ